VLSRIQPIVLPLFSLIFCLAVIAAGYFALRIGQSQPAPWAGALATDKGYGLTIDLTQYDDAALVETLRAIQANGLTWLRQPIVWLNLSGKPSTGSSRP
jgi:hypothetical protein